MVRKMVTFCWLLIVIACLRVSAHGPSRQTRSEPCPNQNGNACLFITCENGGQCLEDPSTLDCFKCHCLPGYTGRICDTAIVPGCNLECQNGGVCTVNGLGYICKCASGWNGTNCNIRDVPSSCTPSPCGSHGTCVDAVLPSGVVAYCVCDSGWTGRYCDATISEGCYEGYCLWGGTCRVNGNGRYCECTAWYTGKRCESLIESNTISTIKGSPKLIPSIGRCSLNTCLHGGTCLSNSNSYICVCISPWTGSICHIDEVTTSAITTSAIAGHTLTVTEVPLNVCFSNPCLNDGTCFGNNEIYKCICILPWTGTRCDVLVTATLTTTISTITPSNNSVCASNPCINNGLCVPIAGSFFCFCKVPFTGTRCEMTPLTTTTLFTPTIVTEACMDDPCENGGTCVPFGSSYFCFCGLNSIYTGKDCDSTTPMSLEECPLNCTPGHCIFSGYSQKPYACLWNGVMRPVDGTTE